MKALVTGLYVFPFGESRFSETGGGIDSYVANLLPHTDAEFTALIADGYSKGNVTVKKVPYLRGTYLRNISYNLSSGVTALFTDYDVLITNDIVSTAVGVVVSRLRNKPHIAHWHGAHVQKQIGKGVQHLLKRARYALRFPTVVVCHDERTAKLLRGWGARNVVALHPGVKSDSTPARPIIMFVGRLQKVKNVDVLIQAMAGVNAQLWVVGDGPERDRLEALAQELHVDATFLGHQQNTKALMKQAGLLVLPSESEALGLCALEAMAYNVPCIVSDLGIFPKDCALTVKPGSISELHKAIMLLKNNEALNNHLTTCGRAYAERFDWGKAGEEYTKVIKNAK